MKRKMNGSFLCVQLHRTIAIHLEAAFVTHATNLGSNKKSDSWPQFCTASVENVQCTCTCTCTMHMDALVIRYDAIRFNPVRAEIDVNKTYRFMIMALSEYLFVIIMHHRIIYYCMLCSAMLCSYEMVEHFSESYAEFMHVQCMQCVYAILLWKWWYSMQWKILP